MTKWFKKRKLRKLQAEYSIKLARWNLFKLVTSDSPEQRAIKGWDVIELILLNREIDKLMEEIGE